MELKKANSDQIEKINNILSASSRNPSDVWLE